MNINIVHSLYIISSILFIYSLSNLSNKKINYTSNIAGIIGIFIAVFSTIFKSNINGFFNFYILILIILGGFFGIIISYKTNTLKIPELIAVLHSLVGLSSTLISFNSFMFYKHINYLNDVLLFIEISIGSFVGTITFIGSLLAFLKLKIPYFSKSLFIFYKNKINFILILTLILFIINFIFKIESIFCQTTSLLIINIISIIIGFNMIISISGSDMPIVISILNSYSGWSASIAGFMLNNNLLIITGALVGSSGLILSKEMCASINKSFYKMIYFNNVKNKNVKNKKINYINNLYNISSAKEICKYLKKSNSLIIVPGYGMAVSQSQFLINDLIFKLNKYKINIKIAVHPVAGRLPGHMNVLLAEAKINHKIIFNLNEINNEFKKTNVSLVIGANDTVNPLAYEKTNTPISGMSVLKVWESEIVFVLKRSMKLGYSEIENPLFFKENVKVILGDAKKSLKEIINKL